MVFLHFFVVSVSLSLCRAHPLMPSQPRQQCLESFLRPSLQSFDFPSLFYGNASRFSRLGFHPLARWIRLFFLQHFFPRLTPNPPGTESFFDKRIALFSFFLPPDLILGHSFPVLVSRGGGFLMTPSFNTLLLFFFRVLFFLQSSIRLASFISLVVYPLGPPSPARPLPCALEPFTLLMVPSFFSAAIL